MTTLRESAQAYEPKLTKNIADLEKVPIDMQIYQASAMDKQNKPFTYNYIVLNDEEYRVPDSVQKALKEIMAAKPEVEFIKVTKTGEGLNSSYTVINL